MLLQPPSQTLFSQRQTTKYNPPVLQLLHLHRRLGLRSQNTLRGCVWEKEAGQTLFWWGSALLHTLNTLEPVSQPHSGCQSLAAGSAPHPAPGAPVQPQSSQMTGTPTWERAQESQREFNLRHKVSTSWPYLLLESLWAEHHQNQEW